MPYRDLREFLTALEEHQELRTIQGADWNLEIGTITELNYERQGPAFLFDSIKDYPKGYRILTNAMDNLPVLCWPSISRPTSTWTARWMPIRKRLLPTHPYLP